MNFKKIMFSLLFLTTAFPSLFENVIGGIDINARSIPHLGVFCVLNISQNYLTLNKQLNTIIVDDLMMNLNYIIT